METPEELEAGQPAETVTPEEAPPEPAIPLEPAEPILSRFLFVDVAAMRAKQLRRGALSRLNPDDYSPTRLEPWKAERIAMEEVRLGLVYYDIPEPKRAGEDD